MLDSFSDRKNLILFCFQLSLKVCLYREVSLAPVAGHHASCRMVKPQQLLMGLKIVCQSQAPAAFSLMLFVPGTLVGMQEGPAAPKPEPKAWVGKEIFVCVPSPFLLFRARCEQEKH